MARCSAAKAANNPQTNFMAPGEPNSQVEYGPRDSPAALEAGG
jgi:NADH dehydrogenase (ubiquinone) Fe-S protein 1